MSSKSNERNLIFEISKIKNKKIWSTEEDITLLKCAKIYKERHWEEISKHFRTKTALQCFSRYNRIRPGKQIRDRYLNVLDPSINKGKFTKEEDELLTKLYRIKGQKWAEISKFFPNRTTDMIKNRFHSSIKKIFFVRK